MSHKLLIGAVLAGVTALSAPAQAQFSVELGVGAPYYGPPRVYERPYYRPVIERRLYRSRPVIVDDDEEECRFIVRRRVNRYGELVVRRIRVCD